MGIVLNTKKGTRGGGGGVAWGTITGTLSNQTDLQNALNAKANALSNGSSVLMASATFTFTQANACNVTPLTIATPSSGTKTMLPIAFYYTQEGMGDGFGVSFFIEMTNSNNLTQPIAASNIATLSIELPKVVPANMDDNTIEAGEEFFLTSNGTGSATAGTVTITTIYIEI